MIREGRGGLEDMPGVGGIRPGGVCEAGGRGEGGETGEMGLPHPQHPLQGFPPVPKGCPGWGDMSRGWGTRPGGGAGAQRGGERSTPPDLWTDAG